MYPTPPMVTRHRPGVVALLSVSFEPCAVGFTWPGCIRQYWPMSERGNTQLPTNEAVGDNKFWFGRELTSLSGGSRCGCTISATYCTLAWRHNEERTLFVHTDWLLSSTDDRLWLAVHPGRMARASAKRIFAHTKARGLARFRPNYPEGTNLALVLDASAKAGI